MKPLWGVWMTDWKDWGRSGGDVAVFRTRGEARTWIYNYARGYGRVVRLVPSGGTDG